MIGGAGTRGCEAADYLHEASACEGQKLQPMTKISVAGSLKEKGGREGQNHKRKDPASFFTFPIFILPTPTEN